MQSTVYSGCVQCIVQRFITAYSGTAIVYRVQCTMVVYSMQVPYAFCSLQRTLTGQMFCYKGVVQFCSVEAFNCTRAVHFTPDVNLVSLRWQLSEFAEFAKLAL